MGDKRPAMPITGHPWTLYLIIDGKGHLRNVYETFEGAAAQGKVDIDTGLCDRIEIVHHGG